MLKEMNKKDLIAINKLVQVATADSDDKIMKYIIELNKAEKALFVEIFQPSGKFAVCLRKDMDDIVEDGLIPILDSKEFDDILTKIIDGDKVDISVKDNKVLIKASKDTINNDIELPFFEEEEDEKQSRENVKTAFKTRKYGNANNILTFYKKAILEKNEDIKPEDIKPEDIKPDATCKLDIKKLNIKNITDIFDKGAIELSAKKGKFYLTVGGGKQKQAKNIRRTIKKGETKDGETKDPMNIKGECTVLIKDANCFSLLSTFSGLVNIDMKKDFPLVLKKKIPEHKIGICYLISLLEDIEE